MEHMIAGVIIIPRLILLSDGQKCHPRLFLTRSLTLKISNLKADINIEKPSAVLSTAKGFDSMDITPESLLYPQTT